MNHQSRASRKNRWVNGVWALACAIALPVAAVEVGDVLSFAGADGPLEVTVARRTSRGAYLGALSGYGGSLNATVVETADGWTMDVDDWVAKRVWHVSRTSEGISATVTPKFPVRRSCQTLRSRPASATRLQARRKLSLFATDDLTAGWPADPVTNEIDVLVVFDQSAAAWLAAQKRTRRSFAAAQIAKMNVALANSGLADDFKMTLRGVFLASFDVTKDCGKKKDDRLGVALENVIWGDGPLWTAIRDERERLGADAVMILANTQPGVSLDFLGGTVGISFGLEYDSEKGLYGFEKSHLDESREAAYAACDVRIVELDNSFAHEIGHIMGAGHSDRLSPFYSLPGPQLFPYSSALMYRDVVDWNHYYTIMGYDSLDGMPRSPTFGEIPYYSSPSLRHPVTGSVLGDALHDNVRTLRETYAVISQYRVRTEAASADDEPDVEPSAAEIPTAWKAARTLRGKAVRALAPPYDVQGGFELKCGKAGRNGRAKVSATLIGLDGEKTRYAAKTVVVHGTNDVVVTWGAGEATFAVAISEGSFAGGEDRAGGIRVTSAMVGGMLTSAAPRATLAACDIAGEGEVLADYLPFAGEAIILHGAKWGLCKPVTVRCVRDRATGLYVVTDNYDERKGRTNRSGMSLSYVPKTGLFSGSFKIYARLVSGDGRAKLKKRVAKVRGVVVEGKGFGRAMAKSPAEGPWLFTVE